ncbi:hypothetical protein CU103_21675 [Phyllobacterium sophorae]|uniref:Uncharacterized protein n=1 Tax=Phyllobacterium sophorae TaxID=1520277 RepID=A0A2P7B621_9HYPH|nr:hypothetical protein CU103_21675 [Phyllobacterium sophorae]
MLLFLRSPALGNVAGAKARSLLALMRAAIAHIAPDRLGDEWDVGEMAAVAVNCATCFGRRFA